MYATKPSVVCVFRCLSVVLCGPIFCLHTEEVGSTPPPPPGKGHIVTSSICVCTSISDMEVDCVETETFISLNQHTHSGFVSFL